MTLPNQFSFPQLPSEDDKDKIYFYLKDLRYELKNMYNQIVFNLNGSIRSSAESGADKWTPTLSGSSVSGSFTYSSQIGWSLRQGIIIDLWFSILWTSTTATGTLQLDLPYKVIISDGSPFIGISYNGTSVITLSATPNSYVASFQGLSVSSSGNISGHIRYLGTEDE